jgi:hypothetical protein
MGISTPSEYQSPDLEAWLTERTMMVEVLRQQLSCAQRRMKIQANKKRSECQFEVGDQVYLKLQPFIQQSVAMRSNQKLSTVQGFGLCWSYNLSPPATGLEQDPTPSSMCRYSRNMCLCLW